MDIFSSYFFFVAFRVVLVDFILFSKETGVKMTILNLDDRYIKARDQVAKTILAIVKGSANSLMVMKLNRGAQHLWSDPRS